MLKLIKSIGGKNFLLNKWDAGSYVEEIKKQLDTIYKKILLYFIDSNYLFTTNEDKKKIMQALRHFDEVGISNELWEELYNLKDYEYFYISMSDEKDIAKIYVEYHIEETL